MADTSQLFSYLNMTLLVLVLPFTLDRPELLYWVWLKTVVPLHCLSPSFFFRLRQISRQVKIEQNLAKKTFIATKMLTQKMLTISL